MILIPAWVISLLTAMVAVDIFIRYHNERDLLLLGKVAGWGITTIIYLVIAFDLLNIEQARVYSRWGWVIVPIAELSYGYARLRWKR